MRRLHPMKEDFRPISNSAPRGLWGRLKFYTRFIFDLQNFSIYRSIKKCSKCMRGKVLDVGCGDSPYKHLIGQEGEYTGIDIEDQKTFGYANERAVRFEGDEMPIQSHSIDFIICTEVLEHIRKPEKLISEINRVLKKGGNGIITVPWSARYHYIPDDYYRFTKSKLEEMFIDFSVRKIECRGTDVTAICSKIIVACVRTMLPNSAARALILPFTIALLAPLLCLAVVLGHLSLILKVGSEEDPLGYTILIQK